MRGAAGGAGPGAGSTVVASPPGPRPAVVPPRTDHGRRVRVGAFAARLCALLLAGAPVWESRPLLAGPAFAQDSVAAPLTLDDVLLAVDAAHPLLGAARAREEAAAGDRMAAEGALDPTLKAKLTAKPGSWDAQTVTLGVPVRVWGGDVTGGWARGAGDFEDWQGDLATAPPGEATAAWTLPLLRDAWTDRRRAARARAVAELDVAAADRLARTLEVRRAAGRAYYDWVAAGGRLRVAEALLALADERDRAFAAQVELGETAAIVREDSRRLVLERTDRRIQAQRALEQARIELSLHVRTPDGARVLVPDSALPGVLRPAEAPVDLDAARATARARRPEIARLQAQRAQTEIEARLQSNQTLPALDFIGEGAVPLDGGKAEWKFGAQTDWTLGARPARGRLAAAEAALRRIDDELVFAQDRVDADVLDAASAVEAARARLTTLAGLVGTAERVAEAERAKLQLGDSNLIFVNQREISVAEAELLVIDARLAASRGWVDLLAAQGVLGD